MSANFYLNFHGIGAPHDGVDANERPYWLTLERFTEILNIARKYRANLGMTFDDGNHSDLHAAVPALRAAGFQAEFFIPTNRIGAPHYLDAADIRALVREGMGVGSHGLAHVRWSDLNDADLDAEIAQPLRILTEIVQAPVHTVGVPFGAYDDRVLKAMRRHGITKAYTSDGGPARPGGWLIPRNSVRNDTPLTEIEARLAQPRGAAAYYMRAGKRVARRFLRAAGR